MKFLKTMPTTFDLKMDNGKVYAEGMSDAQKAFHACKVKFRDLRGGRGSGKSSASLIECLLTALYFPGSRGVIIRRTFGLLKETEWHLLKQIITQSTTGPDGSSHPEHWIDEERTVEDDLFIKLTNGSEILGWNARSWQNFSGLALSWVYIAEASEIEAKEAEECWLECMARLRHPIGPHRMWCSGIPAKDWRWKKFVDARHPDYEYFRCKTEDNVHTPEGYAAMLRRSYSDLQARKYLDGEDVETEGLVYHHYKRNVHLIHPDELKIHFELPDHKRIPDHWVKYRSIDVGGYAPAACLFLAMDEDGNSWAWGEIYERGLTVEQHAKLIMEKGREHGYSERDFAWTTIDPSSRNNNRQTRISDFSAYEDAGILNLIPGNNDVLNGISRVQSYLQIDPEHPHPITRQTGAPRLFILSDLVKLPMELEAYTWGSNGKPVKDMDHLCDCLRYYCMQSPYAAAIPAERRRNPLFEKYLFSPSSKSTLPAVIGSDIRLFRR